ncbi:MAG TPA: hypothetical protein VF070_33935 [Streptosporangiaceae bacterium]
MASTTGAPVTAASSFDSHCPLVLWLLSVSIQLIASAADRCRGMPLTCADHQTGKRWSIFRADGAG